MWPSAHPQMPVRAYFASFHSINSLTPCRAYSIQRTHKGQRDTGPWRHQKVVGKRKHGTQLQPKPKLITLLPATLNTHCPPGILRLRWWADLRAYHLPSLRGWEAGSRDLICMTTCPQCHVSNLRDTWPWPSVFFWNTTEIKKPHKGIKHCHLQRRG